MLRLLLTLAAAASAAGLRGGLCEQGGGFDPGLRLILSATQLLPGGPPARSVVGGARTAAMCAELEARSVFRCDTTWSDGASGFALSGASITAAAQSLLDAAVPNNSVVVTMAADSYYESPIGLASPPPDPPVTCVRARRMSDAAPSPCAPPAYGGGVVVTQPDATTTLSFMSAYEGSEPCFPACQGAGDYRYAASGKGVTLYIVDQAVANHSDLAGRISPDRWYSEAARQNEGQPCASWHGTHVAALAAGTRYGVAKQAEVVSVAVQPGCNGDGRVSDLLAGLDWVLARQARIPGPAVVSMSLIVAASDAGAVLEVMVKQLIEAGVTVVVAAGNFADDACNYQPANLPDVVTVAALQLNTLRGVSYATAWPLSNTGPCVSIWAPGAYVQSASSSSWTGTAVYSGTSQATPMVSGTAAQYLEVHPAAAPDAVRAFLVNASARAALITVPLRTVPYVAQVSHDC